MEKANQAINLLWPLHLEQKSIMGQAAGGRRRVTGGGVSTQHKLVKRTITLTTARNQRTPRSAPWLIVKIVILVCVASGPRGGFYIGVKVPVIEPHCSLTISYLVSVSPKKKKKTSHYWFSSEANGVISAKSRLHLFTC